MKREGKRTGTENIEPILISRAMPIVFAGLYQMCKLSNDFFVFILIHSFDSSCIKELVVAKHTKIESNKDKNKGRDGRNILIKENPIE